MMKLMKLAVMSATMAVVFVSSASASPLPCVSGDSMANYVALGSVGCTIGNELFSNFVYGSSAHGTGVKVDPSNVFLTPVGAGTYNPGIIFSSSGWVVPSASPTANSLVDSTISFTVSILDGSAFIEDGTLLLSSYTTRGTGVADITETINPSATQLQVDSNLPLSAHKTFAPVSSVNVLKDLLITVPQSSDAGSGFAQINSFEEDFSQTPEPMAPVLVLSGLIALGFQRRRANQKN
jgi:hypothetical protein